MPTTCPLVPTCGAAKRATTPVPHATSSTRSPGRSVARSMRRSAHGGKDCRYQIALVGLWGAAAKLPAFLLAHLPSSTPTKLDGCGATFGTAALFRTRLVSLHVGLRPGFPRYIVASDDE